MTPLLTVAILGGLVLLATALGLAWKAQDGRVRQATTRAASTVQQHELPAQSILGSGATLLQFSSEMCSPCRATKAVLGRVATDRDDVAHIELDVTQSSALTSRFNILQTPTTLILDGTGVVRARIGGAVKPASVRAELSRILNPEPAREGQPA